MAKHLIEIAVTEGSPHLYFVNQKILKNGLISSKGIVMLFGSLANWLIFQGVELVQGTCVSSRNSQKFELDGLR